jgi:hypothetical protein
MRPDVGRRRVAPRRLAGRLVGLGVGLWAGAAQADSVTLMVPAGGRSVPLPVLSGLAPALGQGFLCQEAAELHGWSLVVDPNGGPSRLQPPDAAAPPAHLSLVPTEADCESAAAAATQLPLAELPPHPTGGAQEVSIHALAILAMPSVQPNSIVWNVDAGRLDLSGHHLQGAVLRWRSTVRGSDPNVPAERTGADVCRDPQVGVGGLETCSFNIDRSVPAHPLALSLSIYPAGAPPTGRIFVFDAQARPVTLPGWSPDKLVVTALLPPDASLDQQADGGRLTLQHPEAVGSVSCGAALCELVDGGLSVHGDLGPDASLQVRLSLRPHVFFQAAGGGLSSQAYASVPIQRCPVSLASPPPLRGVGNQFVVLRLGGRCAHDTDLHYTINGAPSRVVQTQAVGELTYAVLRAERSAAEELGVVVSHGTQVVGTARAHTQVLPALHTRLRLGHFGEVDFIPTNRPVTALLPILPEGGQLVPLPVEGVYTTLPDAGDAFGVRGVETTTGWVALRLALRDKSLPPQLRGLNLVELTDSVERLLKPASLPISLADDTFVELRCGVEPDGPTAQRPGKVSNIPFADRDSCHLVLHRERLHPEDGEQSLRISASVTAVDGLPRPEASLDQRVRLRPGLQARKVYLGGVLAPFDRVVVRVGVLADDAHYSVATDEKIGAAPLQWSLIMGTSRARFFATTAFPTGLFRVADVGHSGIMGLNSGVLFRLVGLTDEGRQTLVGLEAGMMWLGIAGDQTKSKLGQAGLVAGISIGVPIANVSRVAQASISLHAWAEYEISRAVLHTNGQPWGFVFGPSLSLGDVGVNF